MKREIVNDISYALSPKDVTALAHAIITHTDAGTAGRATYLRSLLAGVQVELIGKPVLRHLRANHKPIAADAALAAFEKVNAVYYEAVLAALPDGLSPLERQAKTSFARSSASTLRRALKLGWDVLTPVGEASKVTLSRWVSEHAAPRPFSVGRAQKQVVGYTERILAVLKALPRDDSAALRQVVLDELAPPQTQRLRDISLRRQPPERVSTQ